MKYLLQKRFEMIAYKYCKFQYGCLSFLSICDVQECCRVMLLQHLQDRLRFVRIVTFAFSMHKSMPKQNKNSNFFAFNLTLKEKSRNAIQAACLLYSLSSTKPIYL